MSFTQDMPDNQDIEILRQLAEQYMSIASLPIQKEKVSLWKDLNRSNMSRPMVAIDQLPWHELNHDDSLTCRVKNPFWRTIELELRKIMFKWNNFPVDMVVEPFILIPKAVSGDNYGIEIVEEGAYTDANNDIFSHHYENQIKTEDDISLIKDMKIFHDEKQSELRMQQAELIFKGIAPIRQRGGIPFHLGVWDKLSMFMGIESIYYDIVDRPDFVHKVIDRITNATLAGIRGANELGVHDDILNLCHCSYVYTDDLLPDFGAGKGSTAKNSWAFGMAQLFTSVSPDTTEEFELPYIAKMASEFGYLYYGCCDRLDDRLELFKTIPNLRKLSCSPWSNRDIFAEKIGKSIIMSNKPTPAYLAETSMDVDKIKKDIIHTVGAAKKNNVNLEIILKDVSTVNFQPQRLTDWADEVMRIVEK